MVEGDHVYVADTDNDTIRVLSLSAGTVATLVGQTGVAGFVDGVGSAAQFYRPKAMGLDAAGNLYVADAFNNAVRKVVPGTGAVTTLATFQSVPQGFAVDGGDLLVSLEGLTDGRIVRIQGAVSPGCAGCTVSDVAGSATAQGYVDAAGAAARFASPSGMWNDGAGTLYVADSANYVLRAMALSSATVTTYAGALSAGSADGTGSKAHFSAPQGLAADDTTAYVADTGNHTIRRIDLATGAVTTLAGSPGQSGHVDGPAAVARFDGPQGLALDTASQTLFVADTLNRAIRQIDLARGSVSTPAYTPAPMFRGLDAPSGLALYRGQLFVTDYQDDDVVMIDLQTARVSTFAGAWGTPGTTDGVAQAAGFYSPEGIAADGLGNLYVADNQGCVVRRIEITTVTVTTIAGQAPLAGSSDGTGAAARFDQPYGVAADTFGDVFVADSFNNLVRRVHVPEDAVTTVIGSRTANGVLLGPLPSQLTQPTALALTPSNGLLLVSENAVLLAH